MRYYLQLKNMYIHMACTSKYPFVSLTDFATFCHRSKIFDQNITFESLETAFNITNQNENEENNSQDRVLHRYEFFEMIVILAIAKFFETSICRDVAQSVEKLIEVHIMLNN